ncbi:MAG: TVP38/TMEM64 family protein [Nitrospirae bacterium]|nr:TVP38/TMEM64 family protein [Nitrospirota bacterium]
MKRPSSQTVKFIALVVFVALSAAFFQMADLGRYVKPEAIRAAIQSVGPLAPVLYLLIYSIAPVFFVPGWIITIGGGLAFGAVWGTVLTVIGATIGATLAFFVARTMGRDFVARVLKEKFKTLNTIDEQAATHGFQVIFFLRLIPLVPFNVLDYVAGISKIGTRDYILATFLGIIPGTFAYVYLGSALTNIYSWKFALGIGLLVLLAVIPLLYKRWKGQRSPLVR